MINSIYPHPPDVLLPDLERKPRRPDQVMVVAYFAFYEDASKGLVPGARRDFQQYLRRSVGSRVSLTLSRLEGDGFLVRLRPDNPAHADRYGLHPNVPSVERSKWIAMGTTLFAPNKGLLGTFLARPAIKHGHIMMTGFLVLSTLLEYGPMTRGELSRHLANVMHRGTVRARLERLNGIGITDVSEGVHSLAVGWSERLTQYEHDKGLSVFASSQDRQLVEERRAFHLRLAGGPQMANLKATLRQGPCTVCGVIPAGEVEHYPPRRWGGFDHPRLLLSICRDCNISAGIVTRDSELPRWTLPRDAISGDRSRARIYAAARLAIARNTYIRAHQTGQAEVFQEARHRAARAFPAWCATHIGTVRLPIENRSGPNLRRGHRMWVI